MFAKILVVDDEPDLEHLIRQKFRRQIRENLFHFVFANNGMDALKKLDENGEVDILLTDINMPVMDGLTLLTKVKERDELLKPVIVSAYGDMENIRTAMNRGAYDFITKPINLQDLEVTINKTLAEISILKEALKARDSLIAIERELDIATKIQTSILPRTFPAFPERKEFDIYAKMLTANQVGGDFYDFFRIDKYRIGFTIGDVSGKGVPAAMLMAVSRTLLKATALKGITTDACLAQINNVIAEESSPEMFVSIFYGILDARNGMLEYSIGGHNPPILVSANGRTTNIPNVGGIFVGVMKDVEYESMVINLKPGDILFLYTDGINEAMDKNDNDFGVSNLEACLKNTTNLSLQEITQYVLDEVKAFSAGVPQADDITVMALKYFGNSNGSH